MQGSSLDCCNSRETAVRVSLRPASAFCIPITVGCQQGGFEMKRISVIAVLLVASTFLLLVLVLRSPDPYAPQLRRLQAPPSFQSSPTISYDFLSPRPFASNEMLIHAASNRTNFETFLYDIEDKKIVGQLINGSPVTLIDRSISNLNGPTTSIAAHPSTGRQRQVNSCFGACVVAIPISGRTWRARIELGEPVIYLLGVPLPGWSIYPT